MGVNKKMNKREITKGFLIALIMIVALAGIVSASYQWYNLTFNLYLDEDSALYYENESWKNYNMSGEEWQEGLVENTVHSKYRAKLINEINIEIARNQGNFTKLKQILNYTQNI